MHKALDFWARSYWSDHQLKTASAVRLPQWNTFSVMNTCVQEASGMLKFVESRIRMQRSFTDPLAVFSLMVSICTTITCAAHRKKLLFDWQNQTLLPTWDSGGADQLAITNCHLHALFTLVNTVGPSRSQENVLDQFDIFLCIGVCILPPHWWVTALWGNICKRGGISGHMWHSTTDVCTSKNLNLVELVSRNEIPHYLCHSVKWLVIFCCLSCLQLVGLLQLRTKEKYKKHGETRCACTYILINSSISLGQSPGPSQFTVGSGSPASDRTCANLWNLTTLPNLHS